ncbi:mariner Mos1 transposase [Trichonephila clavipes]|nr:mariner Mos1 transposase [Trichonephila clavipes]
MFKVIELPTKCEIWSVIRFLTARNMLTADIHRQIVEVYGPEAMSDGKVRKWEIHDTTLSLKSPVSRSVAYKIVTEDLKIKKLCSRLVPRLLTPEHKEKMFAISLDFLIHYEEEGDDMLSRIVTGDKTWVSHITPESKQQSMEWRHTSSPVKVKARHC